MDMARCLYRREKSRRHQTRRAVFEGAHGCSSKGRWGLMQGKKEAREVERRGKDRRKIFENCTRS
jgi:hypothetical protein